MINDADLGGRKLESSLRIRFDASNTFESSDVRATRLARYDGEDPGTRDRFARIGVEGNSAHDRGFGDAGPGGQEQSQNHEEEGKRREAGPRCSDRPVFRDASHGEPSPPSLFDPTCWQEQERTA